MFKMNFEFDREDNSVELINAALSGMRLSAVEIEDENGYLATTTQYKDGVPASKSHRYGFDNIAFKCERDEGEGLMTWQMDVEAFPKAQAVEGQTYVERWRANHPGRVVRVMTQISFDSAVAFIVLHHERKS